MVAIGPWRALETSPSSPRPPAVGSTMLIISPAPFVAIKRARLDTLIVDEAVRCGATFAQGRIAAIAMERDGLVACSAPHSGEPIIARVVVVATGAAGRLPQRAGLGPLHEATHVAIRCYVRSAFPLDAPVMSYHRTILPGCAWLFPLGHGEYNVGCCVRSRDVRRLHIHLQETFKNFLFAFPLARQLMDRAVRVTPLRGGTLGTGLDGARPCLESGGLLAVGEAIGTTLPLSGEGVGKAMESGEVAADVVHDALRSGTLVPLRQYPARLRVRMKPRYASYEAAERWITRPWPNDLTAMVLSRSARLRDGLAGVLRETADPRAVFSLAGLLTSIRTHRRRPDGARRREAPRATDRSEGPGTKSGIQNRPRLRTTGPITASAVVGLDWRFSRGCASRLSVRSGTGRPVSYRAERSEVDPGAPGVEMTRLGDVRHPTTTYQYDVHLSPGCRRFALDRRLGCCKMGN